LRGQLRQRRIRGEAAEIVNDGGAEFERALGDRRTRGAHRNGNQHFAPQPLEDRDEAAQLILFAHAGRAGAREIGDDVQ